MQSANANPLSMIVPLLVVFSALVFQSYALLGVELTNGGFEKLDEAGFPVDWGWFSSSPEDVTVKVVEDAFEGKNALLMEARSTVTVGVNRTYVPSKPNVPAQSIGAMLPVKRGAIVFRYKLLKCESDNVRLYAIPMKVDNFEGGAIRAQYIIPQHFVGDGRWHIGVLSFDFSDKPEVHSVQVGLRINEGGKPAPAAVIFDDIRFVEVAGWHLNLVSLSIIEGKEAGKEGTFVIKLQNTGDKDAPVKVSLEPESQMPKISEKYATKSVQPSGFGEVVFNVNGLRVDGMKLKVRWNASEGVTESLEFVCRSQVKLRLFNFANAVSFVGSVLKLRLLLANDGNAVAKGVIVRLKLSDGLTLINGKESTEIAIFPPGERRIEWQLRAKSPCVAFAEVFASFLGESSKSLAKAVVSNTIDERRKGTIAVSAGKVRLLFPQNPFGYGVFAIEVFGKKWERVGYSPSLMGITCEAGGMTEKFLVFSKEFSKLRGGGLLFPIALKAANDVEIRGEIKIEPDKNSAKLSWRIRPNNAIKILAIHSPMIFVGDNLFGKEKDAALLPGVYWLIGGEKVTDTLYSDPPHHLHIIPHPYKLTQPIMLVGYRGDYVGLMWDALQNWSEKPREGSTICPQPIFIVPNEVMGQENSLLGLMVPNVPFWVKENEMIAQKPLALSPGEEISLSSWLIGGSGGIFGAYDEYFARFPLTPIPERPYSDEETLKRSKVGERSDRYGKLAAGLRSVEVNAIEAARTQRKDGSWAFAIDRGWTLEMLKKFAPHRPLDDYGKEGDTTVGTCTFLNGRATALLRYARMSGSKIAEKLGMKAIKFIDRAFIRPEGAQTWEVPLHCPDVLASANAIHAYLEAWQITGDKYWLERAIYWAKTGIPFIYLWNPPDRPKMMRYASIPVFGTSFFTAAPWFGTPVQWNGLDYAYALLKLSRALKSAYLDKAGSIWQDPSFWRHIAEGITVCAIEHQAAVEHPDGNYPDSVSLTYRYGPNDKGIISPYGIARNIWLLRDEHDDAWGYETTFVEKTPIRVTSEAVIAAAKLLQDKLTIVLLQPKGVSETTTIVACISAPKEIRINGKGIEQISGCSWRYDIRRKLLTIKIAHFSEKLSIEISGIKPEVYGQLGVVWEKPSWEFEFDADDWVPVSQLEEFSVKFGILFTKSLGGDPYMHSPSIEVDASKYRKLSLRIRLQFQKDAIPIGQLFWIREDEKNWSESKSIKFPLPIDGNWHEISVDLSKSPEWRGKIIQIRLDPGAGTGISIEIDYIRLEE
ncbi:MAG: hypothetical protein RMK18_07070 [Armatimonadota bacterium]|nr:hypothetical protein [Armatimonadota bacterium]MDW8025610.1 hypothetical protein [Armatimonadota bacterium]